MLKGLTPPEKETLCAFIRNAMDQLDKADMQILLDNLADARWGHTELARALTDRGFKANDDQTRRHRTGKCICVK